MAKKVSAVAKRRVIRLLQKWLDLAEAGKVQALIVVASEDAVSLQEVDLAEVVIRGALVGEADLGGTAFGDRGSYVIDDSVKKRS